VNQRLQKLSGTNSPKIVENIPQFEVEWWYPGMEITGIASQFAMQSRPICDASSQMRRNNCDA